MIHLHKHHAVVTFGKGDTFIGRMRGESTFHLVLETVEPGALGTVAETGRPVPESWEPGTEINWKDGRKRVVLSFENEAGALQLLEALKEVIAVGVAR